MLERPSEDQEHPIAPATASAAAPAPLAEPVRLQRSAADELADAAIHWRRRRSRSRPGRDRRPARGGVRHGARRRAAPDEPGGRSPVRQPAHPRSGRPAVPVRGDRARPTTPTPTEGPAADSTAPGHRPTARPAEPLVRDADGRSRSGPDRTNAAGRLRSATADPAATSRAGPTVYVLRDVTDSRDLRPAARGVPGRAVARAADADHDDLRRLVGPRPAIRPCRHRRRRPWLATSAPRPPGCTTSSRISWSSPDSSAACSIRIDEPVLAPALRRRRRSG